MGTVTLSPNGVNRYHGGQPPDVVFVGTVGGVVELRRAAGSWTETGRALTGLHVSSLAIGASGALYAGSHDEGVHRRTGTGWEPWADGLASRNVYSLMCAPSPAGTILYAGTEPALLFRRREDEATWQELGALRAIPGRERWDFPAPPHVAHAKHVDVDPRDPQRFYVSVEQGALLKTIDGGRTFRQLAFRDDAYVYNNDAHRVALNPFDPDELYLSGGDGITRSTDGGETWERRTTPAMRIGYPDALFCSPLEDGTIFTAGAGGRPRSWRATGSADAGMARSRDRGRTWEMLPLRGLRGNIEAVSLVSWPGGYGFFAATTDGEVYRSADRGETWSAIAVGLPAVSKGGHYETVLSGRTTTSA